MKAKAYIPRHSREWRGGGTYFVGQKGGGVKDTTNCGLELELFIWMFVDKKGVERKIFNYFLLIVET